MRITANQVTAARLLLMPLLCGLVYADERMRLYGVAVGTVIGLTDLLDGWLARKQGPTVLGGLMDPVADKVFIAVCYLPFADRDWAPWWFVAAVLLRELVVTALRSSFEVRGRQMPSEYLAKVKTWVQMAGFGLLILGPIVERAWMLALLGGVAGAMLIATIVYRALRGTIWRSGVVGTVAFLGPLLAYLLGSREHFMISLFAAILGITWVSAWSYFRVGARELFQSGTAFDFVRVAGAALLPLLAVPALRPAGGMAWAPIALVATEIAHHGLDNLLAHHRTADQARAWGGRMFGEAALLGAALIWPAYAGPLALAALALGVACAVASFATHRARYLDVPVKRASPPVPRASGVATGNG
jgi:CDP-diacylglycerol--glycerol-3-phosphate 3-phosphatidyltransferase